MAFGRNSLKIMTNTELKEFFAIQFTAVNEKIETNHAHQLELLSKIETQTTKANDRVNDHDKRLNDFAVEESRHMINCPRMADIKAINEEIKILRTENELWRIAMKYPKAAIGIIALSVIVTFVTVGYTLLEMHTMIKDFKIEQKK